IGMARDPLRAQHRRLDLFRRQHQGRQVEAFFEDVAHAGLAADGNALTDKRGDIAINRAFRGLELGRDCVCRQWLTGAPKHLDDLEQPVGASHRISLAWQGLTDADSMLSAGAFYNGTTLQRRGFLMMFSRACAVHAGIAPLWRLQAWAVER